MTVDESPSAFKCRILNNMMGNRQYGAEIIENRDLTGIPSPIW